MLGEYSYHHYQCSYPVINSHYYCITWTEGRVAQRDSLAQPELSLGALHHIGGPFPVRFTGFAWQQL